MINYITKTILLSLVLSCMESRSNCPPAQKKDTSMSKTPSKSYSLQNLHFIYCPSLFCTDIKNRCLLCEVVIKNDRQKHLTKIRLALHSQFFRHENPLQNERFQWPVALVSVYSQTRLKRPTINYKIKY